MTVTSEAPPVRVALIGNPNTGKSTLFQSLSGLRQRVGNYPGVTVEKKVGTASWDDRDFSLYDLPGTYSLAPRSPDEMVAVDVLLGRVEADEAPQVVLCIVDASNLERNLYLVSQLLELGRPVVVALNMMDVADARGITIDVGRLSSHLGVPVVPLEAHRRVGLDELRQAVSQVADAESPTVPELFPEAFYREVQRLSEWLDEANGPSRASDAQAGLAGEERPRYLLERLLLDTSGYLANSPSLSLPAGADDFLQAARERLTAQQVPIPAIEAISRYEWVREVLDGVVQRPATRPSNWSDRLDQVLTHKLWGTLIFAGLMLVVFQTIFSWAAPLMNAVDGLMGGLGAVVAGWVPTGALQSLVVDGVIGGVGGVLVFLPQILILFFFIALLEDCGYMARAAFLMDKLMAKVGLSGKSFIPLLSSFACAIPGVMAARVIENRRDRLATILVAPLMSCSARLPVYLLMTAAFVPSISYLGGWLSLHAMVIAGMYLLGVLAAVLAAWLFKRFLFPGETPPFVMELPPYKFPSFRVVALRLWERGWSFIRRAGTLILAISILLWAAAYYPRNPELAQDIQQEFQPRMDRLLQQQDQAGDDRESIERQIAVLEDARDRELAARQLRQSALGRLGRWIEPAVKPLGWDWRIGCAVIASFPAREVVIGAMGVIYELGDDQDEASQTLQEKMRSVTWDGTDTPVFNVPVAISLMVFFALCAQCAATLVVIRRETNHWKWAVFTFVYMTALAYAAAWITYQVGMRLV